MLSITTLTQMQGVWHRQGLFMGMHWAWWLFWIFAAVMVLWAFWRHFADRREMRQEAARVRQAETSLREQYARGEIDQEQLVQGLTALFAPTPSSAAVGREQD